MKLVVFKGFDSKFLSQVGYDSLVASDITDKLNVFKLDEEYSKKLVSDLTMKNSSDKLWITYEEYELAIEIINSLSDIFNFSIEVVRNNIYPEIYPIEINLSTELYNDYISNLDNIKKSIPDEVLVLEKFYSKVEKLRDKYYVCYHNFETPNNYEISKVIDYYSMSVEKVDYTGTPYIVDIDDNVMKYIEHIETIEENQITMIGYKIICNTEISKLIYNSLQAYADYKNINKFKEFEGEYIVDNSIRSNLVEIAKDVLKIPNFNFRQLYFYKQPEVNSDMEGISQAEIMEYIITEAENAYNGKRYRDIFMTAPTGAGKSLIFQIPSILLSKKYGKLVIIVEPLKGLQLDQQKNLEKVGYYKSAYLNSDIATMIEREQIIENVKSGKIDILYVSPETLLSNSIESLIGDREIGLVIVDEAHIVTSWGVGFRPDYWYLGTYLNKMRTKRDKAGKEKKHHAFPIFACTATAVNGGSDDTVSETVISLYMNDPIIKIGSAKRDNIIFEINNYYDQTLDQYQSDKIDKLSSRIYNWIEKKEKTIIYCPYSTIAHQMKKGERNFRILDVFKDETGVYTGGFEEVTGSKNEAMRKFKEGEIYAMYATKAFGMGIDIPDISNVYHYAVTGGLSDYIQEIGRAARDKNIIGKAIVDYFNGDMKYMNALFGMSQIKQFHVKKCLSIIYDVYKNKGSKSNFLVNPKMFESVFGQTDDDQLINKLKIVLLMLEKDLYETFKTHILISRPSSIFTKGYVSILYEKENLVLNSKYGKYFKKIEAGRNQISRGDGTIISDMGDVFEIDMKSIWEDLFGSQMSFAKFKYNYFKDSGIILGTYSDFVKNRVKIKITSKKYLLNEMFEKAKIEIDYLTSVLFNFERNYFTELEFKNKIKSRYTIDSKAEVIANTYFSIIDSSFDCVKKREINGIENYQVSNGNIREHGMKVLKKSNLLREFNTLNGKEYTKYYSENINDTTLLKLLSLLDLISYEIEGGNSPEIFIRLNAPDKIKRIVEDRLVYKNRYVEIAKEKHFRSIKILDYFFKNFEQNQNKERWDFIEDYFLGKNLLEKIETEKNNQNVMVESISAYIDVSSDKYIPLDDFSDWDMIIKRLFNSYSEKKYIYYCNLLKNNNIDIPSYAFTDFDLGSTCINTIFIFEDCDLIIVDEYFGYEKIVKCKDKGWKIFKIDELDENIDLIRGYING